MTLQQMQKKHNDILVKVQNDPTTRAKFLNEFTKKPDMKEVTAVYMNNVCDGNKCSTYRVPGTPFASASSSANSTAAAKPATIKHSMTFALAAKDWKGDTKLVYETAYGIAIGIYTTTTKAYKPGCSITSAITTRRSIKVQFTAKVSSSLSAAASKASKGVTPAIMVTSISTANTALQKNVTVPSANDIKVDKPVVTHKGGSSDSSKNVGMIVGVALACFVVVAILIGIVVWCVCCRTSEKGPLSSQQGEPSKDEKPVDVDLDKT